jgi:integrase
VPGWRSPTQRCRTHTPHLSPQTLTRNEQQALSASTADHPRESLLLSLALGTGLSLGERVGLNVGDVYFPGGLPRERVSVRGEIAKGGRVGDVFLPDAVEQELRRFWLHKAERREHRDPIAPLSCGLSRRRLSPLRVQVLFHKWQEQAGFDRSFPFHGLRHTAVPNKTLDPRGGHEHDGSARSVAKPPLGFRPHPPAALPSDPPGGLPLGEIPG